jgi:O-antigen/teichoic acid export membrane protein
MKKKNKPAYYLIGAIIPPISGILLLPILMHRLSPADYGLIAIVELMVVFGAPFIGFQQESALNRLFYDWEENEKKNNATTIITTNLLAIILFGALTLFLIINFMELFLPKQLINLQELIILYSCYLILTKHRPILNIYLRIKGFSFKFLVVNILYGFIQLIFIIKFVIIDDGKLFGYTLALLISEIIFVIFGVVFLYKENGFGFNLALAKKSLKFSIPLIPAAIISNLLSALERSILLNCVSLTMIGIYTLCQKVASAIILANNSLKQLFVPQLFQMASNNEARHTISKYRNNYLSIIILISIFALPAMTILVYLIKSTDYSSAEAYYPLFVLMALISSSMVYLCSGPMLSKKTHLTIYIPLLEFIIFSLTAFYLVEEFNMNGVVAAKLISSMLAFTIAYNISQKAYHLPFTIDKKLSTLLIIFGVMFLTQLSWSRST